MWLVYRTSLQMPLAFAEASPQGQSEYYEAKELCDEISTIVTLYSNSDDQEGARPQIIEPMETVIK